MTDPRPLIHPTARFGFQGAADAYERGRPGYPDDAVRALVENLGIGNGSVVLDLAAGTGKMTRLLVPTGARVVAVEPVEAMRSILAGLLPETPVLAGTAESLPVPDAAFDAAVVAQAFHWFDGPAAIVELHRVLRPGGRLGLVWNVRDDTESELGKRMTELFDRYRDDTPAFRDMAWRDAFEEADLFTPLEGEVFPHAQHLTIEGLLDRVLSVSMMAALPEEEKARVREEVIGFLPAGATEIDLPYRTEGYWADRR